MKYSCTSNVKFQNQKTSQLRTRHQPTKHKNSFRPNKTAIHHVEEKKYYCYKNVN